MWDGKGGWNSNTWRSASAVGGGIPYFSYLHCICCFSWTCRGIGRPLTTFRPGMACSHESEEDVDEANRQRGIPLAHRNT